MTYQGRFLSIEHMASRARDTLLRFPYTLGSAIVGTATAIYIVEVGETNSPDWAEPLLLACALGLPLFTALSAYAERRLWATAVRKAFPALGVVPLAAYFLSLPDVDYPYMHMVRFLLLALAAHALVAYLPFLGRDDRVGFWQYNKSLFLRLLLASIYYGVLFAGLALALLASDQLFGLDVDPNRYAQLSILLLGVFQTWVFLAGIPKNLDALNSATDYPPGLKVFTQFILLPLVVLYFVILIVYEAKILATWNWPKGWVGHLVLWYSVVSILSLLLLHPLQTQSGNRWISTFGTWFFRGLVPLLVMLYFAIYQRIADYGVTVNRFLVVNMAVGLTVVVLYFVLGRSRDIRSIPIVLSLLCLLSAYGPFSAFSVSERSQRGRLEGFLANNGLLTDGVIQPSSAPVNEPDRREMSSIVDYLVNWHGAGTLAHWVDTTLESTTGRYEAPDVLCRRLGFEYQPDWRYASGRSHFYHSVDPADRNPVPLTGWTYLLDYRFSTGDSLKVFSLAEDSCFVAYDSTTRTLEVRLGTDRSTATPVSWLGLGPRIRDLAGVSGRSAGAPDGLIFDADSGSVACRWYFHTLSGTASDNTLSVDHLNARLLLGQP